MNRAQHVNTSASRKSRAGRAFRSDASVLIIVLWVIFGLISLALYFGHAMSTDLRASDSRVAGTEADLAIEGARRYFSCVLSNLTLPGAVPDPQSYLKEAVPVGDARFWVIGRTNLANNPSSTTPNFGLIDEASKLNINYATSNMLVMLPRMTPDIAASILTWRSTNTSSTAGGAESDTYMRQQPPYLCKNAPFESVDELRLIYNMTSDILYGEDANLNGVLDPNENDGSKLPPEDNQDGQLDPGILEYVTVYSREPGTTTNGATRFNVTTYTRATSGSFLSLMSTNGIARSRATAIINQLNSSLPAAGLTSPLQLYLLSGMSATEFEQIEPLLRGARLSGLVNINTASATVLACLLPNNDIGTANQIITYRQANQSDQNNLTSVAWITQVLDRTTAISIGPWITGRSYQFMADIAAVGHNGRGFRRTRFIYDVSAGAPKILHRQDLSYLGWALGKQVRDSYLLAKDKP